jgi:hypothetical protein
MKTEDEQDAYFLSMVSLIADRHDAKFEIDMDNRSVNFLTCNVTEQLVDDIDKLFGAYGVD